MKPRIWIKELVFSDNTKIPIDKNAITVIVGPNNSGKSASLREMVSLLNRYRSATNIIKSLQYDQEGTADELIDYIDKLPNSKMETTSVNTINYSGFNFRIDAAQLRLQWDSKSGINNFQPLFIKILNTENRILTSNDAPNINLIDNVPTNPIQFLYRDDTLENEFNSYFRQAFGTDIVIHRGAGNIIPLYVGKKPVPQKNQDRVSSAYIKEIEKLEKLVKQGDGMRSYVGVLLNAFITDHSILFIDEPEAFLHPPQAKLLAKTLATKLSPDSQLFISTHSEDFIKGLLDSGSTRISIVRIHREENINYPSILNSTDIKSVWSDPILRYSNILSGLFHNQVVICESESDSKFYSAILASVFDDSDTSPDVLFINCGGKHRIPTVIRALKKLNVLTKVVADFDILHDENPLRSTYEEMNGSWDKIEKDWKMIKKSIDEQHPQLETKDLKEEIERIFNASSSEQIMPEEKIDAIKTCLKQASAWSKAKTVGKNYLPPGNPTVSFENLQKSLQEKGIFVVEVGELECFAKTIGGHGPKWVNEVLKKDLKNDPELETARLFVKKILTNNETRCSRFANPEPH